MHRTPLYRRHRESLAGVVVHSQEDVHRRRQVAGAILTVAFVLALNGGTYGLTALLVGVGWCA